MLDYKPIDYKTWNFDGQGKNILNELLPIEKEIWNKSLEFQDTRRGETGHAECVAYFALKLTKLIDAEREIVIPTAILHDIGWSQLTKSERSLFYEVEIDPTSGKQVWERYEPILRARHQEQGVRLSEKVLGNLNYPQEYKKEILEIISQHDTRKGFLNSNDGIMRDADKLWRFTLPHLNVGMTERNWSLDDAKKIMADWIDKEGFLYSQKSKEIARIEMENALSVKIK